MSSPEKREDERGSVRAPVAQSPAQTTAIGSSGQPQQPLTANELMGLEGDDYIGKVCGRLMVGAASDTYDPTCERPAGHDGPCKSTDAVDRRHRMFARPWDYTVEVCAVCGSLASRGHGAADTNRCAIPSHRQAGCIVVRVVARPDSQQGLHGYWKAGVVPREMQVP